MDHRPGFIFDYEARSSNGSAPLQMGGSAPFHRPRPTPWRTTDRHSLLAVVALHYSDKTPPAPASRLFCRLPRRPIPQPTPFRVADIVALPGSTLYAFSCFLHRGPVSPLEQPAVPPHRTPAAPPNSLLPGFLRWHALFQRIQRQITSRAQRRPLQRELGNVGGVGGGRVRRRG